MWIVNQNGTMAVYVAKLMILQKADKYYLGSSTRTILAEFETKDQATAAFRILCSEISKGSRLTHIPTMKMINERVKEDKEWEERQIANS